MTITAHEQTAVEQIDVDALRKTTVLHLLALAEEHDLIWFRQVNTMRFTSSGVEHCALYLSLDDDQIEAHAAWSSLLGLKQKLDSGNRREVANPFIHRVAEALDALPGIYSVELDTHLYPARGLPEQGPRPTDAELTVAAVLTPDAPELPAEPVAPRSWSAGDTIPADVTEVTDAAGYRAHRHGELWCYDNMPGRHTRAAQVTEPEMLRDHGPVTEAPAAGQQAEDAEDGMPEPCQPIGCDNGYHLSGCWYTPADADADSSVASTQDNPPSNGGTA